jgi:hypothetical protein
MNHIHISITVAAYGVEIHDMPEGKTADDVATYYMDENNRFVIIEFRDGTTHAFEININDYTPDPDIIADLNIDEVDEAHKKRADEFFGREPS